jgi:hypothetical protein
MQQGFNPTLSIGLEVAAHGLSADAFGMRDLLHRELSE